jgi:predicted aconitase
MAMRILVRMAGIYGAPRLLDIEQAHIDSTVYVGDAGMEYAERLAGLGAQVAVPTTLNVSGVDEHGWQEWDVPPLWAKHARRQMVAYQSMGCIPTWTCAPYQETMRPRFGQQIAWGESNAIAFANSVLGARTERYPDLLDVCCAITARAPAIGLHLAENRAGQIRLRLSGVSRQVQTTDSFYTALGYLMGRIAEDQIPVIVGLEVAPNEDQLKAVCATAASSGRVALFHMVGVTPEAATEELAFQGQQPLREATIAPHDLRTAWEALSTVADPQVDMVVLGSPHFSLAEFARLTPLLAGRRRHPDVQFLVTTSRGVRLLAERRGDLQVLEQFGARLTVDTCILTSPMLPRSVRCIMTNAGKFAYYTPGLLGAQVIFGALEDCVDTAVAGHVVRREPQWHT